MKLTLDRLEKVRQRGSRIIARCPACAELDRDKAADNLVIFDNGCFACAAYQQDREHARRILQLAGNAEEYQRSRSGPPGAFPPPRQRSEPAPTSLPPDFESLTLRAPFSRLSRSARFRQHAQPHNLPAAFSFSPPRVLVLAMLKMKLHPLVEATRCGLGGPRAWSALAYGSNFGTACGSSFQMGSRFTWSQNGFLNPAYNG